MGCQTVVCRSTAVATVSEEQVGNSTFLDTSMRQRHFMIKINSQEIIFKLDTGAEDTAISTKTFKTLINIKLQKPVKVLCETNNQTLNVLGQAAYVSMSENNLLGLPAITALQLLTKVDNTQPGNVQKSFAKFFQGLGILKRRLLDPDAKPYALLLAILQETFQYLSMENLNRSRRTYIENHGVISKAEKPTVWHAGMVVGLQKVW